MSLLYDRDIKEHVEIYLDGILCDGDYQAGSVGPQFVLLLFDRLAEIVGDLLALVRQADRGEASQYESSHTYAAAVILHHELCYLHESLRHGHLRVIVRTQLEIPLIVLSNLYSSSSDFPTKSCRGLYLSKMSCRSTFEGAAAKTSSGENQSVDR